MTRGETYEIVLLFFNQLSGLFEQNDDLYDMFVTVDDWLANHNDWQGSPIPLEAVAS